MKRIRIKQYNKPDLISVYIKDHHYSIYLGSGKTLYFTSEKKLKTFISETNRFYNSALHECNYLYIRIFEAYRETWFISDNFKSEERKVKSSFDHIDHWFGWVVRKSSSSMNGNAITMEYLQAITHEFLNIATSLRVIVIQRDDYHIIQRLDMYIRQSKQLHEKLKDWGKNTGESF